MRYLIQFYRSGAWHTAAQCVIEVDAIVTKRALAKGSGQQWRIVDAEESDA